MAWPHFYSYKSADPPDSKGRPGWSRKHLGNLGFKLKPEQEHKDRPCQYLNILLIMKRMKIKRVRRRLILVNLSISTKLKKKFMIIKILQWMLKKV